MAAEVTPNYDSQWAAINAVTQKLGVGTAETVRKCVRQAEVDDGQRPGTTSDESAELLLHQQMGSWMTSRCWARSVRDCALCGTSGAQHWLSCRR